MARNAAEAKFLECNKLLKVLVRMFTIPSLRIILPQVPHLAIWLHIAMNNVGVMKFMHCGNVRNSPRQSRSASKLIVRPTPSMSYELFF